jgi:hypothetical protein
VERLIATEREATMLSGVPGCLRGSSRCILETTRVAELVLLSLQAQSPVGRMLAALVVLIDILPTSVTSAASMQ